ncbi:MAG: NPCBM/NEW2 domain-containing protein [Planctomycetota bacterium]|nr:NPCBM/NEW2 domain-containing protein [Planctomycetota bacterium]
MMNLLISTMLSILAQNPAAGSADVGGDLAWFDGFLDSAGVELSALTWENGRALPHPTLGEWLQLDFTHGTKDLSVMRSPLFLYLQDSSRISGRPVESDGDFLLWQTTSEKTLKIDLRHVLAIAGPHFVAPHLNEDLLRMKTVNDVSDAASGFFVALNDAKVKFETGGTELEVAVEKIEALVFYSAPRVQENLPSFVYLHDGSMFAASVISCNNDALRVATLWQEDYALAMSKVSRITRNESSQLSFDVQPQSTSIDGFDLSIAWRHFNRGWSLTPQDVVALKCLNNGLFAIWVGIDDDVTGFISPSPVTFSIFVNGKLRETSTAKRVAQTAELLRLKLRKNDRVELRSSSVYETSAGAHGDWCQPVFIPLY